ncbi:MAG: dihydroneopterin aldolase [Maledivibacter sp.]|jgi:dihydroneopterin aldolase|nr:dihydroneopterin aldolase [Maledivibacter sp.]
MDKIIMKNLAFFGYHGVLQEENTLGQKFFVDIEIFVDLRKAGLSDRVEDTVHYGEVYEKVKDIVENKRFKLIEALAENIAKTILEDFLTVNEICVKIRKPEAPVKGIFDYFAVEIRRIRNA